MNERIEIQNAESAIRLTSKIDQTAKLLVFLAILFPLFAIAGWVLNFPILTHGHPELPDMQPNTAAALVAACAAILLFDAKDPKKYKVNVSRLLAVLVLMLGLITLSEYLTGTDWGVDRIFINYSPTTEQPFPGRPSPQAALNFILLGSAILIYTLHSGIFHLGQILAILSGLNAIVVMTGYIFNTEDVYGFPIYLPSIGMAITTAISFVLLSLALIFSLPKTGMMALINSETRSGNIARRILFTAVMAPPAVGLLTRIGVILNWYDVSVQISLFFVLIVGLILRSTWKAAHLAEAEEIRAAKALYELHKSQERFELALRGADLGSWDWDIPKGTVDFNARWAQMRGYRQDEIKPSVETWTSNIHPEDFPIVQKILDDYFHNRIPEYECEFRAKTKNGSWIWILDRGKVFLRDDQGKPLRMVGTELDITERKRNEEKVKREVKTREEVLAVVSHDLKNPVSSIRLTAELLKRQDVTDKAKLDEFAGTILRSTSQMQQLIGDLLDFSKIESGTFSVTVYAENLTDILDPVLNGVRIQAEARKQFVDVRIPPALPLIACDSARLGQVLGNLLGNAVKFTPPGGTITVMARQIEGMIQITVADTGPGIPDHHLTKIFERFWQAEKTKNLGSGLGLSIAKGIVESHGGKIWAESQVGKGTSFHFTVPVASAQIKTKERDFVMEADISDLDANTLLGIHVLIVDDSPEMLFLMRKFLKSVGAEVSEAASASEALEKLTTLHPDVLLTDIEMPEENGFALIQKIHRLTPSQGRDIPIAAMTAHDRADELKMIEDAGFDLKLSKPVNLKKTVAAVRQLASQARTLH